MGKLLINVLYLSIALVSIILLAASTAEALKPKVVLCPAVRLGMVKSPQACTNMCKKMFGSLYYNSLCKSINKKRPSSFYDVELFKWSKLFMCGCSTMKDKKMNCSVQTPSAPTSGDGVDGQGVVHVNQDLKGATPCSSHESVASSRETRPANSS